LLHGDENSLYKQWLTRGCVLDDLTCLFHHPTCPTSRLPGPCSTCQDVSAATHCRERTDACCWEKQQTDNTRLKTSIGLINHLQIAYSAFQCLPVLYQVRHFRYRYRNRYRFSISIGSIGIGGVGGIVLTLLFHIGNFCFWVPFLKQLLLRNCAVDFVEICQVYVRKMIIKDAKRIFNSDKICCSYSDLNFGVSFFGTHCRCYLYLKHTGCSFSLFMPHCLECLATWSAVNIHITDELEEQTDSLSVWCWHVSVHLRLVWICTVWVILLLLYVCLLSVVNTGSAVRHAQLHIHNLLVCIISMYF